LGRGRPLQVPFTMPPWLATSDCAWTAAALCAGFIKHGNAVLARTHDAASLQLPAAGRTHLYALQRCKGCLQVFIVKPLHVQHGVESPVRAPGGWSQPPARSTAWERPCPPEQSVMEFTCIRGGQSKLDTVVSSDLAVFLCCCFQICFVRLQVCQVCAVFDCVVVCRYAYAESYQSPSSIREAAALAPARRAVFRRKSFRCPVTPALKSPHACTRPKTSQSGNVCVRPRGASVLRSELQPI